MCFNCNIVDAFSPPQLTTFLKSAISHVYELLSIRGRKFKMVNKLMVGRQVIFGEILCSPDTETVEFRGNLYAVQ